MTYKEDNPRDKLFPRKENLRLHDYLDLLRSNIWLVVMLVIVSTAIAAIYAFYMPDVYQSTSILKLSPPNGNILEAPFMSELNNSANDRFIANEIEIMKSYKVRENAAVSLRREFYNGSKDSFYLILKGELRNPNRFSFLKNKEERFFNKISDASFESDTLLRNSEIASLLSNAISIYQKRGLDIVEINAESQSPYEAAIIANCYALEYINLNLQMNRTKVSITRRFLEIQKREKYNDLRKAEDTLKIFQQSRGIVELNEQSKQLVNQLGDFDAQKNAKELEISMYERSIAELKSELLKMEPKIADALESSKLEAYLKEVQIQIARIDVNKDYALSGTRSEEEKRRINDRYSSEIKELKKQESEKINSLKSLVAGKSALDNSMKLGEQIIEYQVKLQASRVSLDKLRTIVKSYETRFSFLPKRIIEFAQLQRQNSAYEKLYQIVEEKYQEALVNEQSTVGNVQLVDIARKSQFPVKPERGMIILLGLLFGVITGFSIIVMKNQITGMIKTPEDIQKLNIRVLASLPRLNGTKNGRSLAPAMIALSQPFSKSAEAFRSIRTRINFFPSDTDRSKTLLITSSFPLEGKSSTAINLASVFAQAGKRTLLVDCDLRKPIIHRVFGIERNPGVVDYLTGSANYKDIIVQSRLKNLFLVSAGTQSKNPAELLDSGSMRSFVEQIKKEFDFVVFDSPPIMLVTDSEILSNMADMNLLVTGSNSTGSDALRKAAKLLSEGSKLFLGVVLNKYNFSGEYGNYNKKYYYYYPDNKRKKYFAISRLFKKDFVK